MTETLLVLRNTPPNLQAKGAYMTLLTQQPARYIHNSVWQLVGRTPVIGDGIIAGLNAGYDNRIYASEKDNRNKRSS